MSIYDQEFVVPEPRRFRFGAEGDVFMLMNQATRFLSKPAGGLLSYHPGLWSRKTTFPERSQLIDQGLVQAESTCVTLVLADEIDEIIKDSLSFTDPPSDTFARHNGLGIGIKARVLDRK
ncbi:hypothetical protein SARC_07624 [Sphaeroforma arctica JP610]|uniref:SWI/SNF Subunit INI1 DNA binding domain-containing protein n=1 Tax=Sphaeroforma arctica JP610 TaxID=667725 RepID=A0A0L0FTI5_9EUKA|nr:hypothetical protein SARC_07624 [Sphaeroforma arctica JP610]KNC80009.1 hypothetical protein SARC_07624 [Sphaeroforma arctica JP610]|eukprot:XP_014153911.1 hypothetical protein SARC_07624 [Sphaeroforma arctica JP610]